MKPLIGITLLTMSVSSVAMVLLGDVGGVGFLLGYCYALILLAVTVRPNLEWRDWLK